MSSANEMSFAEIYAILFLTLWAIKAIFNHYIKPLPITILRLFGWLLRLSGRTLLLAFKFLFSLWQKLPPLSTIYGDARLATAADCKDLISSDGIHLGYFDNQRIGYSGQQHLITIAPTGTGKGTTAIIPTMLDYDSSAIVIDPKGQVAAVTGQWRQDMGHEVHYINPFGLHGLPDSGFNPLVALNPQSPDFASATATLAEALIFADGSTDSHWTDSARNLVECLIMWSCFTEKSPTLRKALTPLGWSSEEIKDLMTEINSHDYQPMTYLAGRFMSAELVSRRPRMRTMTFLEPAAFWSSVPRHSAVGNGLF